MISIYRSIFAAFCCFRLWRTHKHTVRAFTMAGDNGRQMEPRPLFFCTRLGHLWIRILRHCSFHQHHPMYQSIDFVSHPPYLPSLFHSNIGFLASDVDNPRKTFPLAMICKYRHEIIPLNRWHLVNLVNRTTTGKQQNCDSCGILLIEY